MVRAVLLGLPDDLATDLGAVLREEAHHVSVQLLAPQVLRDRPDVAFISGDTPEFLENILHLRESDPHLPVVVVTRLPESSRWLDALEAGASDYCGAPFERRQVQWIIDSICPIARRDAA